MTTMVHSPALTVLGDDEAMFREAVRANCASVLVAHNHPSGDPTPSADDVATTARLEKAGDLLEIKLVDHSIMTRDAALSLRERGLGFSSRNTN